MSTNNDAAGQEDLSSPPTTGLSHNPATGLYSGANDPNAAAMNENADAAKLRQLTGEPPGSASAQEPGGLPPTQDSAFEDGT